jgi:mannose-1-phosphate guanylyltransferase
MVLAAGLGTRLQPVTSSRPKALVEIGGRTLLEITLARLRAFGIREVIVNVHHFADMIVDYLKANDHFGMHIEISFEDVLLDTGGGLKKAEWFLTEPFVLHNVDVLSTIDLGRMTEFHATNQALATLAVQKRKTSRYLLFDLVDDQLRLAGRSSSPEGSGDRAFAFSGIHIISPRLFDLMTEGGVFSIITSYLRLAAQKERILAFNADEYYWRDLGRLESLEQAALDMKQGIVG